MQCPKCGSVMVIRTARKGKNAGNQFYGCSRYPDCKGTLEISVTIKSNDTNEPPEKNHNKSNENQLEANLPVFLRAREKFASYQVRFFETIALSHEILENIFFEKVKRSSIKGKNQWRIDFPKSSSYKLNEDQNQIFLVAHKILTRGKITQTSPFIEQAVKDLLNLKSFSQHDTQSIETLEVSFVNNDLDEYWVDGFGTEKEFLKHILLELGKDYWKYVIPQVDLLSLTSDDFNITDNRRVDFLIYLPRVNKKIVIELEGIEHKSHSENDNIREELLVKSGFEVFRIANQEIQNQTGPNLDRLLKTLKQIKNPDHEKRSQILNPLLLVKIIHQIEITILEAILNGFVNPENKIIYFDYKSVQLEPKILAEILKIAATDLNEIIKNLSLIYNITLETYEIGITENTEENTDGIVITYNTGLKSNKSRFIIQDIAFPFSLA